MAATTTRLFLLSSLTSLAAAQELPEFPDGFALELLGGRQVLAPQVGGTPTEAEADGAEGPSVRQQRLSQVQYDRRASVILKVWSTPPPEPEEDTAQEPDTEEVQTPPGAGDPTAAPDEDAGDEGADDPSADEAAEGDTPDPATDPEEDAAAAEAAAAAAAAQAEAERVAAEEKAITEEVERLQRHVTLGDWDAVALYLSEITEDEAKAAYKQMVQSLAQGPQLPPGRFQQWAEKNTFGARDVFGLGVAFGYKHEDSELKNLGSILRQSLAGGTLIEEVVALFEDELQREHRRILPLAVARLLFDAGQPLEAGRFLPEMAMAAKHENRRALNLIARYEIARHADEGDSIYMQNAWEATQAALAEGEVDETDKNEALQRAVELAPKVRDELGSDWLAESFTARPQRGMEILSVVGAGASNGLFEKARQPEDRRRMLELQTSAANALVDSAPERASDWRATLELLAANWLEEAQYTYQNDQSTGLGQSVQRDQWGNIYYTSWGYSRTNPNVPQAISTGEILEIRPSDAWLEAVDESIRPKYAMVMAQLYLKVEEETEAFPFIEALAREHPDRAGDLANEFLRVWARNHNPNARNNRSNPYMYMYGFEQRANSIPLTRSKQERNLAELSEWVARLRALPIDALDEKLLANAFTNAHSAVEVYRLEKIEQVFGSIDDLEPGTLAELVQRMRTNLSGIWQDPAAQKDAGTRRRQKDIQTEVLRGFELAQRVTRDALASHPGEWKLVLALASLLHDENNYRQELEQSSEFTARRNAAFAEFARAASLYAEGAADRKETDETAEPFTTWFYASLGACDLNAIRETMQSAEAQFPQIRDAIQALGGEAAERHAGMFASALMTRMGSANPAVKFRYVRSGLEIAGDHEMTRDPREILDYYDDLVTEIELDVRVDGSTRVGSDEPFGLYVDIKHTREIEREAGGFGKYLVNQNNQTFSYNYGRPTEDYRDKFEEAARDALQEHFDVYSVTFNDAGVNSIALDEYGWRKTPYAYVLLRPRGPEVDRVPSLRLDLDFLDTTGYVVLPVESAPLAIDAGGATGPVAPPERLEIVQTLDERQAREGKLVLEVQARAMGLVPALDELVELAPGGFEIDSIDDQGVSVTQFDDEEDASRILAERNWMVHMRASADLAELPTTFTFGTPLADDVEVEHLRYVDADLESVAATIDLEYSYGEVTEGTPWWTWPLVLAALGLGALGLRRVLATDAGPGATSRFPMPQTLTPFTVLGFLRRIELEAALPDTERTRLRGEIETLERHYFGETEGDAPDLRELASTWTNRVG